MKRGDLLLPNEYQRRNKSHVSGIVIGRSLTHRHEWEVYLSNGIIKDIREDVMHDLFVIVEFQER